MRRVSLVAACLLTAMAVPSPAQPAPTGETRVWCHLCPWNALNNLSHSRRDFPLGFGMPTHPGMAERQEPQSQRDYIYECLSAVEAGIDAFALDVIVGQPLANWLPAVDGYLKAAETVTTETGRAFYSVPCLDSPGSRDPEDLAAYIAEMVGERAASPAWPKLDGRPILWTYAGTNMPAANWAAVFELLRSRGLDLVFILDANSLYAQASPASTGEDAWSGLPTEELDALARLPVALYAFRTDFDRRTMERCCQYLQTEHPQSLAARLTIGTVWPGYWSLGSGWYVDPQCTGVIRDTFAQAADCRWLTVTTWNDYYETTHFQPSLGFGTGRLDLLRALLSRWRGEELWPTEPRLYLWQPNEVQVGDAVAGEVLALVQEGAGAVEARVSLCAVTGAVTSEGAWQTLEGSAVRVATYELETPAALAGGCLYLKLEARLPASAPLACVSQPICVWPAGYHPLATRRGTMWRAGSQSRGPQVVIVHRDGNLPKRIGTSWAGPSVPAGSRLHVRHNFGLIHFPGEAESPVVYDMEQTYGQGRAPWEVYPPVPPERRWGFYDTVIVFPDGSVRWSEPQWVPPQPGADLQCAGLWHLDEAEGSKAADASPYAHHAAAQGEPTWQTPGAVGSGCLRLDGKDDCLSVPGGRFPRGDFTVSAWIKLDEATSAGSRCIYVDINGCIILAVDKAGHLTCSRAHGGGWAAATGSVALPAGEWTHVAVTYDRTALRLYVNGAADGEAACEGERASNVTAIGCNPFGARSGYFAGCLDEVRVLARAQSADEVAEEAAPGRLP